MRQLVKRLFPDHTWIGSLIRRLAILFGFAHRLPFDEMYPRYIRETEPDLFVPPVKPFSDGPLFSVVIPFFNTPDKYLNPLLDSLVAQTFGSWELIMADASTDAARAAAIRATADRDPRFHYFRLDQNLGISGNTNQGLIQAVAPYVAFADHDDTLSPHALNEMAHAIKAFPDVGILYSDEDVISDDGLHRKRPAFKPDWSPHTFLETNYTNHLSVVRRELIERVSGLRPEYDGSQDYDLLLRIHALAQAIRVIHVPKVLYHWREATGSTAVTIGAKPFAVEAGRRALTDHLNDWGLESEPVEPIAGRPGWFHIRPRARMAVDVIVRLTNSAKADSLLVSIREKTVCAWVEPTFLAFSSDDALAVHVRSASADAVVVISEPFMPTSADWLDELAGVLALPETAQVAPLLLNGRGRVASAGRVASSDGTLADLYVGQKLSDIGPQGQVDMVREAVALNPAVIVYPIAMLRHLLDRYDGAYADMTQRPADGVDGFRVIWAHTMFSAV